MITMVTRVNGKLKIDMAFEGKDFYFLKHG